MKKLLVVLGLLLFFTAGIRTEAASLSVKKQHVNKGETFLLTLKGSEKNPIWRSANEKVAAISEVSDRTCAVTGMKKGEAYISCRLGKKVFSCRVRVDAPKIKKNVEIFEEKNKVITVKGLTKGAKVNWLVSSEDGIINYKKLEAKNKIRIFGLVEGNAQVSAVVNGKTLTSKITVKHVCSNHGRWAIVRAATDEKTGLMRKYCGICDKTLGTKTLPTKIDAKVTKVVKWAVSNIGVTKYSMAKRGAGLDKSGHIISTDCSGFVWGCYKKMGLRDNIIMWNTGSMPNYFYKITPAQAKAGDVVYITAKERKSSVGHARFYLGNGLTVECTSGVGVRLKKIDLNDLGGYHFGRIDRKFMK